MECNFESLATLITSRSHIWPLVSTHFERLLQASLDNPSSKKGVHLIFISLVGTTSDSFWPICICIHLLRAFRSFYLLSFLSILFPFCLFFQHGVKLHVAVRHCWQRRSRSAVHRKADCEHVEALVVGRFCIGTAPGESANIRSLQWQQNAMRVSIILRRESSRLCIRLIGNSELVPTLLMLTQSAPQLIDANLLKGTICSGNSFPISTEDFPEPIGGICHQKTLCGT